MNYIPGTWHKETKKELKFRSMEEINRLEALKCAVSRGRGLSDYDFRQVTKEFYNYITTGVFSDEL